MWHRQKERNADWGLVGRAEEKTQFERVVKRVLKKEAGKTFTGLIWLRIGASVLLWARQCTIAFHKMRKIS